MLLAKVETEMAERRAMIGIKERWLYMGVCVLTF
jgi:hypothetical protein